MTFLFYYNKEIVTIYMTRLFYFIIKKSRYIKFYYFTTKVL